MSDTCFCDRCGEDAQFFHVEVQDAAEKPVAHIGGVPLCEKCASLLSDSIIALVRGWCEPNHSRTNSAISRERSENEDWGRSGMPPFEAELREAIRERDKTTDPVMQNRWKCVIDTIVRVRKEREEMLELQKRFP